MRGLSAREIMARLNVSMWQLPAIVSDMRKRKLAGGKRDIAVRRHPGDAVRPATPRHQDRHRQFRQRSIRPAGARPDRQPRSPALTAALRVFGKHWKFRRVARKLGRSHRRTICIGDEIRDIEAADAAGMDSGAVAWGYALPTRCRRQGHTPLFNSIEEMTQRLALAR